MDGLLPFAHQEGEAACRPVPLWRVAARARPAVSSALRLQRESGEKRFAIPKRSAS